MPPRKELCRNFQRGSCQYGDRCKFLHATPGQSNPNPSGFGLQQQMPNPFGVGVQNNSYSRGRNDFGSNPTQVKPFENKWIRDSSGNANSAAVARQSNSQAEAANHKCNDPESCKRIMVEDFRNEMPQWKLTCYGHSRNGPCDIVGDVSCEELRALAYDEAKRGSSLQSIIDREKSLVHSKLVEYQNLVQKPRMISSDASPTSQSPFAGTGSNSLNINRDISPSVSSFSQLNASLNTRTAGMPSYAFGQVTPQQNVSRLSSMFQTSTTPNSSGTFANHFPHQAVQSSFLFGSATPSNNAMNANMNPFSTSSNSLHISNVSDSDMNTIFNGASSIGVRDNILKKNTTFDDSIWSKEWKWNAGEEQLVPKQNHRKRGGYLDIFFAQFISIHIHFLILTHNTLYRVVFKFILKITVDHSYAK